MKIEHIAFWVKDLETMKAFYVKYFKMECGEKYVNMQKGFSSYFLSYGEGARIELMHHKVIEAGAKGPFIGPSHMAINVGSKNKVDQLTEILRIDGYRIICEPRTTGDGFYESVIADPDENAIEIVA